MTRVARHPGRREFLVGCAVALAGCGLLPEEPDPVEDSAVAPATLPESAGYERVLAEEPTIETTVDVDLSGDVEVSSQRDVIATVFRRVHEAPTGQRFGLVTAPAVQVFESPEVVRDPLTALDDARVLELATDRAVEAVSQYDPAGAATLLSTETDREVTTATLDGSETRVVLLRVRAGEDSVTAVGVDPDAVDHPFGDVVRDG